MSLHCRSLRSFYALATMTYIRFMYSFLVLRGKYHWANLIRGESTRHILALFLFQNGFKKLRLLMSCLENVLSAWFAWLISCTFHHSRCLVCSMDFTQIFLQKFVNYHYTYILSFRIPWCCKMWWLLNLKELCWSCGECQPRPCIHVKTSIR